MRVEPALILVLGTVNLSLSTFRSQGQGADYALSFNGTTDSVVISNSPLLELTSGTLEGWFRPDWSPGSLNYDPVLIANQFGPALTRYNLRLDRNLGGIILGNGTSSSMVPYSFTRGASVHLAVVANGTTAQVYVNGLPVGTTSNGFGTLIGLPLNLGSDGVGGFFSGQMDEVRIWNVMRSPMDIRCNVSRALAGTEPGLVGYWRFDEGLGFVANDATTNALNGVLDGTTWTNSDVVLVNTSGSFGLALDFSSSRSSFVQVPATQSLAVSNQFTFETWVKPRTAQCNTILSRGDGSNLANTDYIFQVGTDGTNCGVMKLGLMVAGNWTTSISTVPLNVWTHVAVTYDGTTSRFYINGLLDTAVAATGAVYQSGSPLFIGRQGVSGANYFDGALDEVRVWSSVRSAAQIQANISRTLPANQPGLVGYWQFDNQFGARRAIDASGAGNHGLPFNRPVSVPSFWTPIILANGANPLSVECHNSLSDPGVSLKCIPVAITAGFAHAFALQPDGNPVGWGYNASGQISAPSSATNLTAVAAARFHTLAVESNGSVLGWGDNTYGEISIPPAATNVVAVAAGGGYEGGNDNLSSSYCFSLALKADGTVIGWGSDQYQQLEIPSSANNIVAIAASFYGAHCLALRGDGAVIGWGANGSGQASVPSSAQGAIAVSAGGHFSLALMPNGTVVGWGLNLDGQINIPASAQNVVAIAAGYDYSLALRSDGTVIAWGFATTAGQPNRPPPSATNVVAIAAGGDFSVAVKADGVVLAWGYAFSGNTSPPANVNIPKLTLTTRGGVDTNTPRSYSLVYSAASAAGGVSTMTRQVDIVDTTPPTLALQGTNPLNMSVGATLVDPGATATDACAGDLTGSIARFGSVPNSVPGTYILTYTVADPSGNTASTNRTVLVTGWPTVLGFNAFFSGTNAVTGSPVVQFTAEVSPNGLPTATYAQYGLTTAYPGRTTTVNLPASFNSSTFYATLDGLVPGATYHFRIAATNSLGVTYGPDQTFTVPMIFGPGDLNGDGRVSQGELLGVVSNFFATTSDKLIMTNSIALGRGLFQFGLTNNSGWNFSVLVSTNLIDWSPLSASAQPVWQFLDPEGTNQPRRFYRIRWP
jgi:hypothetical protein